MGDRRPMPETARAAMMGGDGTGDGHGHERPSMGPIAPSSAGRAAGIGLKPERHIAGFSIRKEDGTEIPLIFEAGVGKARDTVVLKLDRRDPRRRRRSGTATGSIPIAT